MKVYNQAKTQILETYDLSKGYLKEDTITIHYEEVKAVEEQGHYETIAEYKNGGKDVKWVVDVEGVEYQAARDEEEPIQVYIEYTESELKRLENIKRIAKLKALLAASDYKAIKYAEGLITETEYAETKALRQSYRD